MLEKEDLVETPLLNTHTSVGLKVKTNRCSVKLVPTLSPAYNYAHTVYDL